MQQQPNAGVVDQLRPIDGQIASNIGNLNPVRHLCQAGIACGDLFDRPVRCLQRPDLDRPRLDDVQTAAPVARQVVVGACDDQRRFALPTLALLGPHPSVIAVVDGDGVV